MDAEVGALGKVLAQQTIYDVVDARLPGRVRVTDRAGRLRVQGLDVECVRFLVVDPGLGGEAVGTEAFADLIMPRWPGQRVRI